MLLIIFMVVAPQLEHGERVELPAVFQPDAKSKTKLDPIYVTVTASGRLFLEKEVIEDLTALDARLREVRSAEPERRVVLKGDGSVKYQKMREAFALCQKLGFAGIALQVSQRGGGAGVPEEG
ncbi:ExbD/TolR family protein [Chondromyces crocatus]|uniref:ExbD/TolR family protein n=1 Tax=Chondromyces crocatus TaxID=52 RepID=UPI002481903B|nr:biopolymer transporter ExbD [Chondromyces crocatus]